jgi:regulator of RNase E activity RraA
MKAMKKTKVETPPQEIIEYLRSVPTPYISDALAQHGIQNAQMWGILPLTSFDDPHKHIAGPALTMRFLKTYNMQSVYESPYKRDEFVETAPAGSVIVIDASEIMCLGERGCATAVRSGLEAVVSNGPIRDVDGIRALRFPIFIPGGGGAMGIKMQSYVNVPAECVGWNMPIYCGIYGKPGALVRPGDIVVGDNNGVVAIPWKYFDTVVETVRQIWGLEEDMQRMIDEGTSWKEIYPTVHARKYGQEKKKD